MGLLAGFVMRRVRMDKIAASVAGLLPRKDGGGMDLGLPSVDEGPSSSFWAAYRFSQVFLFIV